MRAKKEAKVDHCAIDPHFESMVWKWIGNGDESPSVPEIVFWRKVILQALFDFCSLGSSPSAKYNQNQAQRWFLNSTVHFPRVCEYADVNDAKLRGMVARAYDNPETVWIELRARLGRF